MRKKMEGLKNETYKVEKLSEKFTSKVSRESN